MNSLPWFFFYFILVGIPVTNLEFLLLQEHTSSVIPYDQVYRSSAANFVSSKSTKSAVEPALIPFPEHGSGKVAPDSDMDGRTRGRSVLQVETGADLLQRVRSAHPRRRRRGRLRRY